MVGSPRKILSYKLLNKNMLKPETFLTLEESLAARLVETWQPIKLRLSSQIIQAVNNNDPEAAQRAIERVKLERCLVGNGDYIKFIGRGATLFGASRLHDGEPDDVQALNTPGTKAAIAASAKQMSMILTDASIGVRERLTRFVRAEFDDMALRKSIVTLAEELGGAYASGESSINLAASLHTSRLAVHGACVEAKLLDEKTVIVNAVLDSRTCDVCALMDQNVLRVDQLYTSIVTALEAQTVEQLQAASPWPVQNAAGLEELSRMTEQEVQDRGYYPEYHPLCRCYPDEDVNRTTISNTEIAYDLGTRAPADLKLGKWADKKQNIKDIVNKGTAEFIETEAVRLKYGADYRVRHDKGYLFLANENGELVIKGYLEAKDIPVGADGVTAILKKPANVEKYLAYRKEYLQDLNLMRREGSLAAKTAVGAEETVTISAELRNRVEDLALHENSLVGWVQSTNGVEQMAIKQKVLDMEDTGGSMLWRSTHSAEDIKAVKAAAKAIDDDDYLRLRALNQAYMETQGVDNISLYRGVGGNSGESIARKLKTLPADAAVELVDPAIVGYTGNKNTADAFGVSVDGVTVTRKLERAEIIVYEDLFSGALRVHKEERESIVLGGVRRTTMNNVRLPK